MTPVSREKIDTVWERLVDLDEEQTSTVVQQFMQEQPALGLYLYANHESLGAEADQSLLIDLVMACWQAMTETAGKPLKPVSPDQIEAADQANTHAIEALEEASEFEWEKLVRESLAGYNQVQLLGFGIETLMSGHEENPELAPENIGMELLWLRTVIDCLDQ